MKLLPVHSTWVVTMTLVDTALAHEPATEVAAGSVVELAARSMVVLRAVVAPT